MDMVGRNGLGDMQGLNHGVSCRLKLASASRLQAMPQGAIQAVAVQKSNLCGNLHIYGVSPAQSDHSHATSQIEQSMLVTGITI
jgi:hypothetical protein